MLRTAMGGGGFDLLCLWMAAVTFCQYQERLLQMRFCAAMSGAQLPLAGVAASGSSTSLAAPSSNSLPGRGTKRGRRRQGRGRME